MRQQVRPTIPKIPSAHSLKHYLASKCMCLCVCVCACTPVHMCMCVSENNLGELDFLFFSLRFLI